MLTNVWMENLVATSQGGAIFVGDESGAAVKRSVLNATRLFISKSSAANEGGGIHCSLSDVNLVDSDIRDSNTSNSGGGLSSWYGCVMTTTRTTVHNCRAINNGGDVCVVGTFTALNSDFSDGVASDGGGLYGEDGGVITVISSRLYNNYGVIGGAIAVRTSSFVEVYSCEFNGNRATDGAAVYTIDASSAAYLYNSTFANGHANLGGMLCLLRYGHL